MNNRLLSLVTLKETFDRKLASRRPLRSLGSFGFHVYSFATELMSPIFMVGLKVISLLYASYFGV